MNDKVRVLCVYVGECGCVKNGSMDDGIRARVRMRVGMMTMTI